MAGCIYAYVSGGGIIQSLHPYSLVLFDLCSEDVSWLAGFETDGDLRRKTHLNTHLMASATGF